MRGANYLGSSKFSPKFFLAGREIHSPRGVVKDMVMERGHEASKYRGGGGVGSYGSYKR